MRHSRNIINFVKKLRSKGKTYSEILKKLKITIPKSTISYWCRNVILPRQYQDKIQELNRKNFVEVQKMAWTANKTKRERLLRDLMCNNNRLIKNLNNADVLKMLLSILYLGEGAKWKSHSGLMLGSSDPDIIKLYIRLLDLCYEIKKESLRCRISYRADQDIIFLERYWSKLTNIPTKNFYKTKPDPRTIGKITKQKDYKGVCVITCGGTHIQLELEAIPKLILEGL